MRSALILPLVAVLAIGCHRDDPYPEPAICEGSVVERWAPPADYSGLTFGANLREVRYGDGADPHRYRALVVAAPGAVAMTECSSTRVSPEPPMTPLRERYPEYHRWGVDFCEGMEGPYGRLNSLDRGPTGYVALMRRWGQLAVVPLDGGDSAPIPLRIEPVFGPFFSKDQDIEQCADQEPRGAHRHLVGRSLAAVDVLPCRLEEERWVGCGDEILASASFGHAYYLFEPDPDGPDGPYRQVRGIALSDDPNDDPFYGEFIVCQVFYKYPLAHFTDSLLAPVQVSTLPRPPGPDTNPAPSRFLYRRHLVNRFLGPELGLWGFEFEWNEIQESLEGPRSVGATTYLRSYRYPWSYSEDGWGEWPTANRYRRTDAHAVDDLNGDGVADLALAKYEDYGIEIDLWAGRSGEGGRFPAVATKTHSPELILVDGRENYPHLRVTWAAAAPFWRPGRAALLVGLHDTNGLPSPGISTAHTHTGLGRGYVCQFLFDDDLEIEDSSCWSDHEPSHHFTHGFGTHITFGDFVPELGRDGELLPDAQRRFEVAITSRAGPASPGGAQVFATDPERGVLWERPLAVYRQPDRAWSAFGAVASAVYLKPGDLHQTLILGAPTEGYGEGAVYVTSPVGEACR
jgi:hypothetical protein